MGLSSLQNSILKGRCDIYNVVGETDLSENCVKSASKSHILSPERAALAEYTGPIPFFVVPRLSKAKRGGKETQKRKKNSIYMQSYSAT